jgi:hypothetical protein
MASRDPVGDWQVKVIRPRLPWGTHLPRAAEVGEALSSVMLSGEFSLEDAEYQKIVPNEFVVELHEANYLRNYQPIQERLLQQWRTKMLEQLTTANSRQGRNVYHLSGPLRLEIRPATDIKPSQVRILCRVQSPGARPGPEREPGGSFTQASPAATTPCLEMLSGGRRWTLVSGTITIGRDHGCDVHLDLPAVREKRLVSGTHAYLRYEQGGYVIHDGSPDGRASVNGTFVNRKPVRPGGRRLKDGDTIILAAIDPDDPRPDVPGVVALRFREVCS